MDFRQAKDLILIGAGSGDLRKQVADLGRLLTDGGSSLADLCHLRVFHDPNRIPREQVDAELASLLSGRARPALTVIPVPDPQGSAVVLEAAAVAGPGPIQTQGAGPMAEVTRKGRFVFTSAMVAETASGLVPESTRVMERLGQALASVGAGFGDVVRMNRWYHAAGTKDEWEPSARAVAQHYVEPGPIATALSLPYPLPGGRAIQIELMAMLAEDGSPLPKQHSWPEGHWDWPIHLPYKHGLLCDGLAFVGGQVSLDERAEVIDPDHQDRQVVRSLQNIDRVLDGFPSTARRLMHLGIYHETPDAAGFAALTEAMGLAPSVRVGFDYLSYPKMRVEIEAIAALE